MDIVLGRVLSGAGLLLILGAAIIPFIALTYLMLRDSDSLVLLGMGFVFMMGLLVNVIYAQYLLAFGRVQFASIGKVLVFNAHSRDIRSHGCGIGICRSHFYVGIRQYVEGVSVISQCGSSSSILGLYSPFYCSVTLSNRSTPYRVVYLLRIYWGSLQWSHHSDCLACQRTNITSSV